MDTRQREPWFYSALLWAGLFVLWMVVFQNKTLSFSRTAGIQFCYLVFIAANFYFHTWFTIPRFLDQRRYFIFAASGLLFVVVTSWLRSEVAWFINTRFYDVPAKDMDVIALYWSSLLNISVWTLVLVAGKIFTDKIKHEQYTGALEKEKIINELNFLRAQHNPHFLFNSLNSIYFQIDKTNPKAREMLLLLSEMLRYQLYDCSAEKIAIDKEIAYLKNYIELQKVRLNENYKIDFHAGNAVGNFRIAPLLIMPLIENAFKYVSHFTDKSNEISVNLGMKDGLFTCDISNTTEATTGQPTTTAGGIGLKNLQRRLELLYPGRHGLAINKHDGCYTVKLTLQADEN